MNYTRDNNNSHPILCTFKHFYISVSFNVIATPLGRPRAMGKQKQMKWGGRLGSGRAELRSREPDQRAPEGARLCLTYTGTGGEIRLKGSMEGKTNKQTAEQESSG